MVQQEPGVWAQIDEQGQHAQKCLIGGRPSKAARLWVATSYTTPAGEAGLKSQREVVVLALVTGRLTEPRVDVDAWRHPGLPHMRLDFTVVDAEALHCSSAMRQGAGHGASGCTSRENERAQIRKSERRSWSHRHSYAAQRAVRPGTGRISPKACGVQGHRGETVDHYRSGGSS